VTAAALDRSVSGVHSSLHETLGQLSLFVLAVVGIGGLVEATNLPGSWYTALAKPAFVPPNWGFFPVAWTVL